MLKLICIFLSALCAYATQLNGIIIETSTVDEVEKAIEDADQSTLVLFDVDETLILAADPILRPAARGIFNELAKKTIKNPELVPPGTYEEHYFLGLILFHIQYALVDPKIIPLIESLQSKQIKTIAFTKLFTGPFGKIPSLEDWRIAHLRKLDIDFRCAFPHLFVKEVPGIGNEGKSALFKEGVLFANAHDKGPVLSAFLKELDWAPKKVIFVDNRLDYLESVEEALEGTGIDYLGLHYTAVEYQTVDIDKRLAEYQLMHLLQHGVWLSEEEALELCKISF